MKTWIVVLAAASATTGVASAAFAAPTAPSLTVTDLGSSFQLLTDPSGHAYGVSNSDASRTFDFAKSPVTAIHERVENWPVLHAGGYYMYTLQNGDLKRGYTFDRASTSTTVTIYNAPTTVPFLGGWYTSPDRSPVADMNSSGQIVGTSDREGKGPYAAFSDAVGHTHGGDHAYTVDNLNTYIDSALKIDLTAGLKVDDLGRIIAEGRLADGSVHDFLLTAPGLLTSPMPVPEPTALATLAFASAGALVRRYRRRVEARRSALPV